MKRAGAKFEKGQRGMVMVISMILLLVLTILGVSTMHLSKLQVLMAKNSMVKERSFQNSEAAVRTGENEWDNLLTNCLLDTANCDSELTPGQIDDLSAIDWQSVGTSAGTYGSYVVEYLGQRPISGDNERMNKLYRVSGIGSEETGHSSTVVQTIYRYCVKVPDGLPCPDDE